MIDSRLSVVFDVVLRILTVIVRAVFVFYLVKVLTIEDFGRYTYFVASIALFMYLAGADFYIYAHREMLSGRCNFSETIKSQIVFLAFSVAAVSGLSVVLSLEKLTSSYLILLPVLLAGETFAAECVRFLIACGRPSAANAVNFLKSAGWMLPLWGWSYYNDSLSIEILLLAWISGLIVAVLFSALWVPVNWSELAAAQIPKDYFRQALKSLPKILLGTLALRALFSLDRLAVGYKFDETVLGIYGFYVAMASAYLAVLDAGVLARLFPPLVKAAVQDSLLAQRYCRRMEISVCLSGVAAWVLYWLLIESVIIFIGKPSLLAYKEIGNLILIAYVIYAASMGSHYIMYGRKQDVQIMAIHISSLLPFLFFILLASHWTQPELVAWGVLSSMMVQLCLKSYLARKYETF